MVHPHQVMADVSLFGDGLKHAAGQNGQLVVVVVAVAMMLLPLIADGRCSGCFFVSSSPSSRLALLLLLQ